MTSFEMLVGRIQATSEALQQDALVVINRNVTEGRVALSNRLQVELPGLRGFSPTSMKKMRLFFEAWTDSPEIRHLPSVELPQEDRQMPSAENRSLPTNELEMMPIRHLPSDELTKEQITAGAKPAKKREPRALK